MPEEDAEKRIDLDAVAESFRQVGCTVTRAEVFVKIECQAFDDYFVYDNGFMVFADEDEGAAYSISPYEWFPLIQTIAVLRPRFPLIQTIAVLKPHLEKAGILE